MATLTTAAEVLTEITKYETARDAILNAQSYGVGDRQKTMPNLSVIELRLKELRELYNTLSSGPSRNFVRFHEPV